MPAKSYQVGFDVTGVEYELIETLAKKTHMTRQRYLTWLACRYADDNSKRGLPDPAPSLRPRGIRMSVTLPDSFVFNAIRDKSSCIPAAEMMRMLIHEHAAELGVDRRHWRNPGGREL